MQDKTQMGTVPGVCDRLGQSAPSPPIRIPRCRKPNPALPRLREATDPERRTLAESGKRLGRKYLSEVACVAKPETILDWYRRLIAHKFDGSKSRSYPGRHRVDAAVEASIVRMAQENSSWGYDRIVGALANLGYQVSDQTIGNVLKRHGIAAAPKRSQHAEKPIPIAPQAASYK
jgi:hypothetical protein